MFQEPNRQDGVIEGCRSEGQGVVQDNSQVLPTVTRWRMVSFLKQGTEEEQVWQERVSIQAGTCWSKELQNIEEVARKQRTY